MFASGTVIKCQLAVLSGVSDTPDPELLALDNRFRCA